MLQEKKEIENYQKGLEKTRKEIENIERIEIVMMFINERFILLSIKKQNKLSTIKELLQNRNLYGVNRDSRLILSI